MQTGETRGRTSLLVSTTIAPRLLIVANATREAPDGHPRASLFAGLTLSFGAGGTATIGGERAAGQVRSFAEVQRSLPTGAGYGYRLRAEDRDRQLWAGTLEYQNQYGRYEMRRERVGGADHSTIRATGGIVAIGGRLYASRPVQNSFALVRVPDVKGVRAYANRQEVGRTNAKGDLLVPDLLSYYGNLLNISDEDVPFGYEIERIQTTIAPPHRGGALVTFPVRRVQQTVGRVEIDAEGEVTIPAYGTLALMVDGVSITSPIGANGEFYFEDVAPGRHPAMLQHRGRSCAFEVDVPVSHSPVNQLGAITCVDSHTQP
jgi:outer membrane usher protein